MASIHLEGDRFAVVFNIDGCSWVYDGHFDEESRAFTVERVLVGQGELGGGVLHGLDHDPITDRFVVALLHGDEPDAALRHLPGRCDPVGPADARARARPRTGAPLAR